MNRQYAHKYSPPENAQGTATPASRFHARRTLNGILPASNTRTPIPTAAESCSFSDDRFRNPAARHSPRRRRRTPPAPAALKSSSGHGNDAAVEVAPAGHCAEQVRCSYGERQHRRSQIRRPRAREQQRPPDVVEERREEHRDAQRTGSLRRTRRSRRRAPRRTRTVRRRAARERRSRCSAPTRARTARRAPVAARVPIHRPRDAGNASENSAPAPDFTSGLPLPSSAANSVNSAGKFAREPLRPRVAAERSHAASSDSCSSSAATRRRRPPGGSEASELLHGPESEDGSAGQHEQHHETEQKTPTRVDPRLVPEHLSSPRLRFRERFP